MEAGLEVFRALRERDLAAQGFLVAEGRFLAERALAAGLSPIAVAGIPLAIENFRHKLPPSCPVFALSEPELASIAGFAFHRGILLAARRPALAEPAALAGLPRVLVLPETGDPANLGALVRSAAALGFSGCLLGPRGADPFGRRALRASMGAVLPFAMARGGPEALSVLRASGFLIVHAVEPAKLGAKAGLAPRPGLPSGILTTKEIELSRPLALVLGAEAEGIPPAWIDPADAYASIAMAAGPDSLNVAAAGAVLMHALRP